MTKRFYTVLDYLMLTIGALIAAFSIEVILVPNRILDGGIIGIAIMINHVFKIPLGLLTVVLNIPFLILGAKKLGRMFFVKSAYAMSVFSIFIELLTPVTRFTDETILVVCYGGVILGVGVGIIIRFGGCLDGTEAVAIQINRKTNIPVGKMVLGMNLVIYSCAIVLFGINQAMYSLLTYFITSKMLDLIESGLDQAKAALIITDDAEEVSKKIYKRLGRTVTIMQGEGMISGKKTVLYCVLTHIEIRTLKAIINSIDSSAFVTVTDVSEIIGNHIKKMEE